MAEIAGFCRMAVESVLEYRSFPLTEFCCRIPGSRRIRSDIFPIGFHGICAMRYGFHRSLNVKMFKTIVYRLSSRFLNTLYEFLLSVDSQEAKMPWLLPHTICSWSTITFKARRYSGGYANRKHGIFSKIRSLDLKTAIRKRPYAIPTGIDRKGL